MNRTLSIILLVIALCLGCALLAANLILGDVNQDEGWYLYAARMVAQGHLIYRDFAYTQAPILPLVYSLAQPLVQHYGLAGGRVFTAIIGVLGVLAAAGLAAKLCSPEQRKNVVLLTIILLLVNVYQCYFITVVKTYALASFFLTTGFLMLASAVKSKSRLAIMLSATLLTLAAGTRTSAGIIAPLVFVLMFFDRNKIGSLQWIFFGLGTLLTILIVLVPFFLMAPENFLFCIIRYHALRETGGLTQALIYKLGFLSRLLQAYFVTIILWASVVCGKWLLLPASSETNGSPALSGERSFLTRAIWASVAAVTLVHFAAPFPYDDYQAMIYPLFGVAVASMSIRFASRIGGRCIAWLLMVALGAAAAASISSPINQDWFIQGRDRIWWIVKDKPPLIKLRETGQLIRTMTQPGDLLLTQDPYLAVESGLALPHGMEMGQFCYFPDIDRRTADRLHVLNRESLEELLKNCEAPLAALSGYALAIEAPSIEPVPLPDKAALMKIIRQRYKPFREIPNFGQAATTLHILKKRTDNEPSDSL